MIQLAATKVSLKKKYVIGNLHFAFMQGHQGGVQTGQLPWIPWTLGNPWASEGHHGARGLQGAQQRAHVLQRAHQNDIDKSVRGRWKTFFFGGHIKIR